MALILWDARKWSDYGIGTYIRGLFPALMEADPMHRYLLVSRPDERNAMPAGPRIEVVALADAPYSIAGLVKLGAIAREHRVNLVHVPHYTLPFGSGTPSVVTVHDIIHVALPSSPWKALYARAMLARAMAGAERVIVPSEASQRDLAARWPRAAERICVVPNGLSSTFLGAGESMEPNGRDLRLPDDYVLFVGNERPYKNLDRVLDAFAILSRSYRGTLVLAGLPLPPGRALLDRCSQLGIREKVHLPGYLPEASLPVLYRGARLLLAPSLAEGFGLPVLEAMAMGTPVVTARGGAQEELAGDAALLVDPASSTEIAGAAGRLLDNGALGRELAARGRARALGYRWTEAARATLAIYGEVLESRAA